MPIVIIMDEKYILNRLIELRNALKQSGNAFAKKLNIPQTTYLRYETGQRKISADLIIKLVLICNVNPFWLFTGEGNMFINPDINSGERQNDTSVDTKNSQFGKRLSELQAKHNFLDREMSILLKISENDYIKLITGKIKPDLDILNRLKQNFKVSIDYLLYGD